VSQANLCLAFDNSSFCAGWDRPGVCGLVHGILFFSRDAGWYTRLRWYSQDYKKQETKCKTFSILAENHIVFPLLVNDYSSKLQGKLNVFFLSCDFLVICGETIIY
jgi:hypothetical protein